MENSVNCHNVFIRICGYTENFQLSLTAHLQQINSIEILYQL